MKPPELRIRPATDSDIAEGIVPIELESQGSPWSRDTFVGEISNPISHVDVLVDSNERVHAFIVYWIVANEVHLLNVAVAKAARRQGLGRRLVTRVQERAREEAATYITLEVRVGNEPAIHLYESLGFKLVGRRKSYYQDNGEDALVLGWIPLEDD